MKIFEQVAQFTKELTIYIKKGMPNVSPAEYEERLKTCEGCEFITPAFSCGKCGCNMTAKAKWATSDCPEKKWQKIEKK